MDQRRAGHAPVPRPPPAAPARRPRLLRPAGAGGARRRRPTWRARSASTASATTTTGSTAGACSSGRSTRCSGRASPTSRSACAGPTRTGPGPGTARPGEILMRQTYSPDDDLAHLRWLGEAFADPRYIRVDGKPLFLVYRAAHATGSAADRPSVGGPRRSASAWASSTCARCRPARTRAARPRDPGLRRGRAVRAVLQPRAPAGPQRPGAGARTGTFRSSRSSRGTRSYDYAEVVQDHLAVPRAALHALPVCDAGVRQLAPPARRRRDDHPWLDARALRIVAARGRRPVPAHRRRRRTSSSSTRGTSGRRATTSSRAGGGARATSRPTPDCREPAAR